MPLDDSYDDSGYVARIDEKGNRAEVKVSKGRVRSQEFSDLTV